MKRWWSWDTRPGKHTKNYGKSPCLIGTSTISMAIVNSYVCLPEGICRLQEFNILFYGLIICVFNFIYEPIYILSIIKKLKLRYITGQLLNYDFYPTTYGQLNKMDTINLLNHEMKYKFIWRWYGFRYGGYIFIEMKTMDFTSRQFAMTRPIRLRRFHYEQWPINRWIINQSTINRPCIL
jgi:hypothetical protein